MAITDNTFTADEFKAALSTNKDLFSIVKGTIMETPEYLRTIEPDIINPKKKEWAERDEAETLRLTGIAKKERESFHDYRERAFKEKMQPLEDELKTLKDKHNPSEADRKRIEQLESQNKTLLEEKDALKNEYETKITDLNKSSLIQNAFAAIRSEYKKDIPEDLIKLAERDAMDAMLKTSSIQSDGNIAFLDKDGNVLQDPKTYKALTASEIAKQKLASLIDTGKQQQGGGSNPTDNPPRDPKGGPAKLTALPSDVKTKTALTDYMMKNGYVHGTPEFDTTFNELGANLPLR